MSEETIKAIEDYKKQMKRQTRKMGFLALSFILFPLGSWFICNAFFPSLVEGTELSPAKLIMFVGELAIILLLLSTFSKYARLNSNVQNVYYKKIVPDIINQNFGDVNCELDEGYDKWEIQDFDVCIIKDHLTSNTKLKATYNDINFEIAMVYSWYETKSRDKGTTKHYVFHNPILVFPYTKRDIEDMDDIKIITDDILYRPISKEEIQVNKVELESVAFNKKYDVFSTDPHDVFYLLTPQYMEKLLPLPVKTIRFHRNRAIVALEMNSLFDMSIKSKAFKFEDTIKPLQKELDMIKQIIDCIKDDRIIEPKPMRLKLNIKPKGEMNNENSNM